MHRSRSAQCGDVRLSREDGQPTRAYFWPRMICLFPLQVRYTSWTSRHKSLSAFPGCGRCCIGPAVPSFCSRGAWSPGYWRRRHRPGPTSEVHPAGEPLCSRIALAVVAPAARVQTPCPGTFFFFFLFVLFFCGYDLVSSNDVGRFATLASYPTDSLDQSPGLDPRTHLHHAKPKPFPAAASQTDAGTPTSRSRGPSRDTYDHCDDTGEPVTTGFGAERQFRDTAHEGNNTTSSCTSSRRHCAKGSTMGRECNCNKR